MSQDDSSPSFGQEHWKEEGGEAWVEHLDQTEPMLGIFSDALFQRLELQEDDSVLDIGCGGGLTTLQLAKQLGAQGRAVGLDISPAVLAIAQQRSSDIANVTFEEADAGTADLGAANYDWIVSRFGVMFFNDPVAAFANLRRSLKPTGKLAVVVWRSFEENRWMAEPVKAVMEVIPPQQNPADPPDPDAPGPFSLGREERITEVLTAAGFNNISLESVDIGAPMGSVDQATEVLSEMGPAAGVIANANDEEKAAGIEAIRGLMENYDSASGVVLPAAVWIVIATP